MTAIRPLSTVARPLRGTHRFLARLPVAFAAWRVRRAERRALLDVLSKRGDRLLDDVGLSRETAERQLDASPISPWDRWQL